MKNVSTILAFIGAPCLSHAALTVGDIAIIGFYTDGSGSTSTGDAFSWIALNSLSAGEVIHFSDSGYTLSSGAFSTEGLVSYTVPAGGLAAGTVSSLELGALPTNYQFIASSGYSNSFQTDGSPSLNTYSSGGEQLVAFQDSNIADTTGFLGLTAVSSASTGWGRQGSTSASASDLYPGLTDNINAVAVGAGSGSRDEFDNVRYNGPTTGSPAALFAAINDDTNWIGQNNAEVNYVEWTKGTFAVPEPTSSLLLLLSLGGFSIHRSRRS